MKISVKTEYACLAMLSLAAADARGEPVRIREIAEQHQISARFLVQILLQLKNAGLAASTRGASGGYQLARPAREITLLEVMDAAEPAEDESTRGTSSRWLPTLRECWRQAAARERAELAQINLVELLAKAREQNAMYYI